MTTTHPPTHGEPTVQFNPLDPTFLNDPYPFYQALREFAPIHFEAGLGGWVFTRYDDVAQMLRENRGLRPPVTEYLFAAVPQAQRDGMAEFERMLAAALPFANPPHHTRLRKLVSMGFTARAIEAIRPRVEQVTDELLDRFEAKGGGDVIADLARPLPSTVVLEFIGVPSKDHARTMQLATAVIEMLAIRGAADAPAVAAAAHVAMNEFSDYMEALIEERRRNPGLDVLSAMVTASDTQGNLRNEEIVLSAMSLLVGSESTTNFLGNGTLALLRNPSQYQLLAEDPTLAKIATEELLRYDTSSPIIAPQLASEDVEIGGQLIKQGELMYPVIGAANRDPARYADPDQLDLRRNPSGVLSFSVGIHFCSGAALARLEAQTYFAALTRRFPHLHLDPDAEAPVFHADPLLRGLQSLNVRVNPA
jgi:cytochrome P450